MPWMGKTEEDWNGLKLGFLKTVQPNSFSKLSLCCLQLQNMSPETYLFVSNLWFCHLHVNFFAYFKFHSDWGRVIGKIKQNDLDCRDTAPLTYMIFLFSTIKGTSCLHTCKVPTFPLLMLRVANASQKRNDGSCFLKYTTYGIRCENLVIKEQWPGSRGRWVFTG